jgi:hypothetical protein
LATPPRRGGTGCALPFLILRWKTLENGRTATVDATALSTSSLNAAIPIARTLLEPLNVSVTLLGREAMITTVLT